MKKQLHGITADGQEVFRYQIGKGALQAEISQYGAALLSLKFNGTDVVLGYDSLGGYFDNPACMGCVVVPSANRIRGAQFIIDGIRYQIDRNEGENNLHSHLTNGSFNRVWSEVDADEESVTLSLKMKDGELGFPGNREFTVTYSIVEGCTFRITYSISTDKDTVFNPTNHSYFNLSGHNSGTTLDHQLLLNCHYYTPVAQDKIPLGELAEVKDTPFDFTEFKMVGRDIRNEDEQLKIGNGYDHNLVIDDHDGSLRWFASLKSEKTGIVMKGYTTQPGVQLYTGNYLGSDNGKDGAKYKENDGLCLETQYYPNAINQESFEKPLAKAGDSTVSITEYRFLRED